MVDRSKQTAVLKETQQKRKEQKRQQVFSAIQVLQEQGKTITFPNIAQVANVSVSYLYKWPQLKDYIQSLREKQAIQSKLPPPKREPGPHSLKTLHEISRKRINELEDKVRELKQQNQLLRGHVAEIHELKDENERLRSQLRELMTPKTEGNVVSLKKVQIPQTPSATQDVDSEIVRRVEQLGIKLGVRLQKEIQKHSVSQVKLAIAAFEQYRSKNAVNSPGGCLLSMIKNEDEPNVSQVPASPESKDFDDWYMEAIKRGFCLNVPKNLLSMVGNQPMVKVINPSAPEGYVPIPWIEAKNLM